MHKLRNFCRWTLVAGCLLTPLWAFAQAVPDPVQYAMAPEVPGPNQRVLIEAQGVGSLLGDATITWSKDGAVAQSGVGDSSYTFTTGDLGSQSVIDIRINSDQGTFEHEFVFSPSLINLVWEAQTTAPPFYKGKALYSAGSPVKVAALPVVYSGKSRIAPSALSYQWSLNGEAQSSASGLGRSSFAFVGDQLKAQEVVSVDAYYGAAKVAHGEVVIPASNPQLVLYQRDALRGLLLDVAFPPAIGLTGKEITVQAVPYNFSSADSAGGQLSYSWQLNGEDVLGPDSGQGILTLRQTGSGTGAAQVAVSLQDYNSASFVQNASAALTLVFGQTGPLLNNLFGL